MSHPTRPAHALDGVVLIVPPVGVGEGSASADVIVELAGAVRTGILVGGPAALDPQVAGEVEQLLVEG